jgi:hypothetical protein
MAKTETQREALSRAYGEGPLPKGDGDKVDLEFRIPSLSYAIDFVKKQRDLTAAEVVQLEALEPVFIERFGKMVAEIVSRFPEEAENDVLEFLKETFIVSGSTYKHHINREKS